jgi:putative ubiquitin-RnfH superfamily antitoxin RatB of RatAB toxin-antitoxin module
MKVSVAYAGKKKKVWLKLDVEAPATVQQVIETSGVLQQFPEINLEAQEVGIFGKKTKLDAEVQDGNRIEIYRPITADPETVERNDR